MSKKILAKPYVGEKEARTDTVTNKPFHQEAGLEYTFDGNPVSPETAHRAGYELDPSVKPPEDVRSKVELTSWMLSIGMKRGTTQYSKFYGLHAPLYPLENL